MSRTERKLNPKPALRYLSNSFGRRLLFALASTCALLALAYPDVASTQCAVPNNLTNGTIADATQVMGNFNSVVGCVNSLPAGSTDSIQINAGSGALGAVGPLTNGQLAIGSTGAAPQAANLTAGTGIAISTGPGSITISESGGGGGGANYSPPSTSTFSWVNQPSGATVSNTTGALQLSAPSLGGGRDLALLLESTPTVPYTWWMRLSFAPLVIGNYYEAGIALSDSSGKVVVLGIATNNGLTLEADYYTNPTTFSSAPFAAAYLQPIPLIGVNDDGTNINFLVSYDGVSSFVAWSVSRTAFLTAGPTQIGIVANAYSQPVLMNVAHWSSVLPGPL